MRICSKIAVSGGLAILSLGLLTHAQTSFSKPANIYVYTERVLAGIHISADNLAQVTARLGQANLVSNKNGENLYEWDRGTCILRVRAVGDGRISEIEVMGDLPARQIGVSGKGLRLGDRVEEVGRLYPKPPYFDGYFSGYKKQPLDLLDLGDRCDSPPVLTVGLTKAGRINRMTLVPAAYACY